MYGYIRPVKDRLRIGEYRQFRAAYCGLCEELKCLGGLPARFLVSYDMTFFAMVMSPATETEKRRCPLHPLRRCPCVCGDKALETAAELSIILAWWKLRDDISDSRGIKRLGAKLLLRLLRRSYRKAEKKHSSFARYTEACLSELAALEREKCPSLDRTADCFARLLAYAAEYAEEEGERRSMHELFYHVGRSVYLLDALDDLEDDIKENAYNPLRYRFSLQAGKLAEEDKKELRATLNQSQQSAAAALALRRSDRWQSILENIILEGLPAVTGLVFSGEWNKQKKKNRGDAR